MASRLSSLSPTASIESPPRLSPLAPGLTGNDDNDTNYMHRQQQQQQQQQQKQHQRLQLPLRSSKKEKDKEKDAHRLSFMSFMSFMSGKSNKSAKSYAEHEQGSKPSTAERPKAAATRHSFASHHHHGGSTTAASTSPPPRLSSSSARVPASPAAAPYRRRSIGSPESEDDVGELPEFGISERGYLASLVSLFDPGPHNGSHHDTSSSSHSPLSSAQTALTAPSIIGEDAHLGPYEYDVHSPAVYSYAKERRLYMGLPGTIHPPPEALLEFELETLPLLERDLHELSGHLGQRGIRITYELRMSGLASLKGDTVTLAPTVWILYRAYASTGLQSCHLELQHATAKLPYLQGRSVEIYEGGGRIELAGDRRLTDIVLHRDDQIHLAGGGALSVHIEDCTGRGSVCGALCSVIIEEEDKRTTQSLCRIGGLLLVNGKYILGVSTAHGMLDSSNIFKDSFDSTSEPRSLIGTAIDHDAIAAEASGVNRWQDVTRDAAVDFLGVSMNSRGEMAINRAKPENATDFALLRLRQQTPGDIRNQYTPPNADTPIAITSSASARAASLDEGPVYILCGGNEVLDGQLVWGSACFVVRKRNFHLRRVQTTKPLNASTAGAWVVRGEVLYGVIVAVYEDEPFALMMTVERLFSSILGSAFSIRSVELWDGVLPEAYRLHEEERAAKAKAAALAKAASKDRIRVDIRPWSKSGSGSSPVSRDSPSPSSSSSLRKGSKSGQVKETPRLNTVVERAETENEPSGPSGSTDKMHVAAAAAAAAAAAVTETEIRGPTNGDDNKPVIDSPKSYGLPHLESSVGLGILADGDGGIKSAGTDDTFVTADEEKTTTTTTMTTTSPTTGAGSILKGPRLLHTRTESQTSNITMSGAVQTPEWEEKDPMTVHMEEVEGDWHISDCVPGDQNDGGLNDDDVVMDKSATTLKGQFDLKTGPPVPPRTGLVHIAEDNTSSSSSSNSHDREKDPEDLDDNDDDKQGRGERDQHISTSVRPLTNNAVLERPLGEEGLGSGSRGPSLPSHQSMRSSQGSGRPPWSRQGSSNGGQYPPRVAETSTARSRNFFLRRRSSSKAQARGRAQGSSGDGGSLDMEHGTAASSVASSRDGAGNGSIKKGSFWGRFARKNAGEKMAQK